MSSTARLTLVPTRSPVFEPALEPTALEPAASLPAAPWPRPPGLRLTRRGRLVLLVGFLLAIFAGGVLFGSGASRASGDVVVPQAYRHVIVQPGQTLWGIALEAAPGRDPRATIEQIRDLNALTSTGVQAGQRIALP